MGEIVPPEPQGILNKKVAQIRVSPLFKRNKNSMHLEQVLALRGKYLYVQDLPILTDDGAGEYTGKLKIYVKDHEPRDTVELLTEFPYRTKSGSLTRVYARPEDIINARTS